MTTDGLRGFRTGMVLLAVLVLSACSQEKPALTMQSAKKQSSFSQTFSQAFAGKNEAGEDQFVFVSDDSLNPPVTRAQKKGGATLTPAEAMPLRQVVVVKVLWRSINGVDKHAPTANAAIDWYVLNNAVEGQQDLLKYSGAGLVQVQPNGDVTKLSIRSAALEPTTVQGALIDPVGSSELVGSIVARRDDTKVSQIIIETRNRVSIATGASAQNASATE